MTEEADHPQIPSPRQVDDEVHHEIRRESEFAYRSADTALFFPLGHDVEIGFLLSSRRPTIRARREDDDENERYKITPTVTEVARIRMPPVGAATLAFNIIKMMATRDELDADGLKQTFDEILEIAKSHDVATDAE